ncbi:hypothetical protein DFQ27_009028 [Actinomortierella ambigua]|uniref:FAD-binding domain-containing protein n=1 Tax=Actinomortierella ambigua TaxID=1343610 RepID=A0A9P6PSA5_9FUNG|nr:hypothetical protein DFQ27_009028 [Actinomortierella ambigua]
MAPPGFKVIIAGAGISGLSLAIMLERQNVEYVILERYSSFTALGSGISLSPQVLRVYEQLGLLDDLRAVSKPLVAIDYFDQQLKKVGCLDLSGFDKRYGYHSLFFARPELLEVLARHVPSEKIHWNKRILSTMQNNNGAMVRVADGTTYDGDIIIGADGAYSAVRQSLYKNMAAKGLKVDKNDAGPLRFDLFCVLGVTKPLGDKYPVLNEPTARMDVILASKEISYNVYTIPLPDSRISWAVGGHFLAPQVHDQESFRFSEWGSESIETIHTQLKRIPVSIGGTIGELIGASDNISNIMIEDKLFNVWHEGRTVLMGDAAHKLIPAGGQGANQAILDAVCLANLLHEMPSSSLEDIKRVFTKYSEIRSPPAKKAVEGSAQLSKLMINQGWFADILRSLVLNLPPSLACFAQDAMFSGRPILNFIDPIPLKGYRKDSSVPHTLD